MRAQVDNDGGLSCRDLLRHILNGKPWQPTFRTIPVQSLRDDITSGASEQDKRQRRPKIDNHRYRLLKLVTERIAEPNAGIHPENYPQTVVEKVLRHSKPHDPGKGWGDRAQTRAELRDN